MLLKDVIPFNITTVANYCVFCFVFFLFTFGGAFTGRLLSKGPKGTLLELISGSVFIAVSTTAFYSILSFFPFGLFVLISMSLGFGLKKFFKNLSDNQTWRKFDLFSRLDIVGKFLKDSGVDDAQKKEVKEEEHNSG